VRMAVLLAAARSLHVGMDSHLLALADVHPADATHKSRVELVDLDVHARVAPVHRLNTVAPILGRAELLNLLRVNRMPGRVLAGPNLSPSLLKGISHIALGIRVEDLVSERHGLSRLGTSGVLLLVTRLALARDGLSRGLGVAERALKVGRRVASRSLDLLPSLGHRVREVTIALTKDLVGEPESSSGLLGSILGGRISLLRVTPGGGNGRRGAERTLGVLPGPVVIIVKHWILLSGDR